jgi:hypothetical protein
MLGKKLDVVQKTSTVLMMYSIFNISTSSQFRTVPYGWCGPSEHAVVSVVVAENGNGHYSVILAIIQLFSPLFSYSRHYPVILAFMSVVLALRFCTVFNYSILFYLLCVVQSAVYIWSRPSVPGKLNFFNLLEHIIISKANDSVELKPNKKSIGMLAVWLFAPEPEIREV